MILNPVDFKNYLYCPRQIYYKYVYKLEVEPTVKMLNGSDIHLIFSRIEKRRSLKKYGVEKFKKNFGVKLYSKEEMLSGEVDMILEGEEEFIPVDFKMTQINYIDGYILQLYSYSRIIKSFFNKKSEYGFLVFINTERIKKIIFDDEIENYYLNIKNKIIEMIDYEKFPEAVNYERCSECEYINFCGDVE